MAKQGAGETGGITPSKRSPVSGSSAETIGALSVTSRRTCAATSRMMRSASVLAMCSPVSWRPIEARSIHSLPSGLTITSMTVGSASAAAMVGPNALRSICRRRPGASSAAATEKRSPIVALPWFGHLTVGLGQWEWPAVGSGLPVLGRCTPHAPGEQVGFGAGDGLEDIGGEPLMLGDAASHLGQEHVEAFLANEPRRLLVTLRQRRRDGQEVANEQSQGLTGNRDIPANGGDRFT